MTKKYFPIFPILVILAQMIVPSFSQAKTFDPYAASDAQGNFLKLPLGYPSASNAGSSNPEPPVLSPTNSQSASNEAPITSVKPKEEAPAHYTYADAPSAFSPITDRILADPTFLTSKGQILGDTAYSYSNYESNRRNYLDQKDLSYVARGNHVSQSLAYGLTDDLSLRVYTKTNYMVVNSFFIWYDKV
jgi:hypothetical protein